MKRDRGSPRPGIWQYLPFPLRSVLHRWRSLIGMIVGVGIALGIGMMMLGVSKASAEMFTGDFHASGIDVYVLTRGGMLVPLLPGDSTGTIDEGRGVLGLIRSTPGVNAALGVHTAALERERPGPRRSETPAELISVVGIDGDAAAIPDAIIMQEGRWLQRADELVLGARLSRELRLSVGHTIRLGHRELTIVGVGRLRGAGLTSASLAYMDMQTLRPRLPSPRAFEWIMVDTGEPGRLIERLDALGDLRAIDRSGALAEGDAAMASDRVAHNLFIGLTLAIAALFVGSMLGRSVMQRRLDFATMRAIGMPDGTLRTLVVLEALLVSAPAAVIGVLLSTALGAGINATLAPLYGMDSFYRADAELIGFVVAMAAGVGVIAGVAPARRAARVDPIDVLREA